VAADESDLYVWKKTAKRGEEEKAKALRVALLLAWCEENIGRFVRTFGALLLAAGWRQRCRHFFVSGCCRRLGQRRAAGDMPRTTCGAAVGRTHVGVPHGRPALLLRYRVPIHLHFHHQEQHCCARHYGLNMA